MDLTRDLAEITAIRDMLASAPRPVGWAERRKRIAAVGTVWPVADDIAVERVDAGGVPAEWSLAPGSNRDRVLVYLHGGGYCSGGLDSHRRLVTEAGRAAGARTLALDYRLAPENPFPAALDDALAAWSWLRGQGIAAGQIALAGDSAGGGLSLALMMLLRDRGEDLPACAWLISPWTDLTLSGPSLDENDAADPLIHRGYLAELAGAYLPPGLDPADPRVSPLFGDLAGLPPLLIHVGSSETLLDDAVRLARRAGAAEVPVTLRVWPHMIHAFPMWNGGLDAGRRALREAGAAMRRRWDGD
jgi:acetyl esterase/lipase